PDEAADASSGRGTIRFSPHLGHFTSRPAMSYSTWRRDLQRHVIAMDMVVLQRESKSKFRCKSNNSHYSHSARPRRGSRSDSQQTGAIAACRNSGILLLLPVPTRLNLCASAM